MQAGQNLVVGSLKLDAKSNSLLEEGAWIVRHGDTFSVGTTTNWNDADEVTGVLMSIVPTAIDNKVTVCYRGAVDALFPPHTSSVTPGELLVHPTMNNTYGQVVHRLLLPSVRRNPQHSTTALRVYVMPTHTQGASVGAIGMRASFATPAPLAASMSSSLPSPNVSPPVDTVIPELPRISSPLPLSSTFVEPATKTKKKSKKKQIRKSND